MTICDTKLYQMSENDPNTEIFKVFSVFGQTKCHSLGVKKNYNLSLMSVWESHTCPMLR